MVIKLYYYSNYYWFTDIFAWLYALITNLEFYKYHHNSEIDHGILIFNVILLNYTFAITLI